MCYALMNFSRTRLYGEGVALIIDVVRANEFLQDEIGIGTSPDPSVRI